MWDFYNLILRIPEKGIVSKTVSWSKVESQVMGCSRLISVVPLTPEKIRLRLSRNRNYLTGEGILLGGIWRIPRLALQPLAKSCEARALASTEGAKGPRICT